ncbi:type IV toxin-antitoxin system AbiEi family antitoxin domain-containing protein [Enterococcus raffinosus]|uniref:Type IV toxin-antitoxin system AbiEi family antitoxin domain-containing protein n=1 Tax=Enterococcus raffinosus TaxID=71452 RepID=A0AAW8TDT5_9ENTE|nr:type IV toxin-antitoxin system AbiEi family antitoxin domain-containing protein [Enterococcus raffinosus]MDT2524963.1 type IV toxin-antitoxin system AbiEi family antitoxin domain-containing protein [Enterococcus raffinosus]MDT2531309.1 type IV toxin-antitoxin system AbiEi family antitoxin domain-containing protein [Enterococcus raffinosus]MDT2535680.1 type IV toxin-antitoxin system AbiEi family antitoxin domain-containing protein [Enterococcus raffinosus]MDT2545990.1 type IV toxin-antitoxin 
MKDKLFQLLEKRDGNLSMKEARAEGIAATTVQRLVESGKLLKISRGYYVLDGHGVDELFMVQSRFSKGIFSHETALDLYSLSTNIPKKIHLSVPSNYHIQKKSLEEEFVHIHKVKNEFFELGMIEIDSYQGNPIKVYDKERTICDMWNPRYNAAFETKLNALKDYMREEDRDPIKLRAYREQLNVDPRLANYMEALY